MYPLLSPFLPPKGSGYMSDYDDSAGTSNMSNRSLDFTPGMQDNVSGLLCSDYEPTSEGTLVFCRAIFSISAQYESAECAARSY